jgi:hypothetical protein
MVAIFDGEEWRLESTGTTISIEGFWGGGPDRVFAVGGRYGSNALMLYDGNTWQSVFGDPRVFGDIRSIWGDNECRALLRWGRCDSSRRSRIAALPRDVESHKQWAISVRAFQLRGLSIAGRQGHRIQDNQIEFREVLRWRGFKVATRESFEMPAAVVGGYKLTG